MLSLPFASLDIVRIASPYSDRIFSFTCVGTLCLSLFTAPDVRADDISFNRDIRPLLSDRCFACHGPDEADRQASLRLDTVESDEGAYREIDGIIAIKPGSVENSEVWKRIISDDEYEVMPPPEAHKPAFTDEEKEKIRKWIEEGAPYESFWAFVKPSVAKLPDVTNVDWKQPVDRFVIRSLTDNGKTPAQEADKRTLIRRLTLDLTGLPPTREEIADFLADKTEEAYEKLVDRLLSRHQYGEHMARYWLDLVRFADTNGMHKDFYRNFVAYRDWVIRSFNANQPYDDFVRFQLAGDLFESPTNDQLIASGYNRLHLIIDRGTALPEESFFKNVVDRVSAFGTVFMGMTVQCAQCHDHKYDPLTQKDYYSLFAFFNNIDAAPETVRAPPAGIQPPFISLGSKDQDKQLADLNQTLRDISNELKSLKSEAKKELADDEKSAIAVKEKQLKEAQKQFTNDRNALDREIPKAMIMKEREEVRQTFVMLRGEYDKPGDEVSRAAPEFLPALQSAEEYASRMDLANWLVSRENPLTARTCVNRVWQQFFGVGLVKTSEDLGAQGEVPSHPRLLDYLATTFMDSGWDIKALVKEIVMSQTYRQSSRATEEQYSMDPDNRLLARGSRFRLDAETIRDQILATSGLLSDRMYGPSVKPPQPPGLWKAVTMTGEVFRADSGEAIRRRSLYTYWKRAMPPPQMTIMNAPNRDACIARRERTNTPSQALLLLNEAEYLKAARNLAEQVLSEEFAESIVPDDCNRISLAYETVTSHLPDTQTIGTLTVLLSDLRSQYAAAPELAEQICEGGDEAADPVDLAAWTVVVNTLYNLDATKTRE